MPVAAIVGHGPGLGESYATVFGDAGYDLALLSRSGGDQGGDALSLACDVADGASLGQALDRAERDLGPIDVLIYNASLAHFGPLEEITPEAFEASWRVDALGLFNVARHLAPKMTARGSGAIIVSGATAALRGNLWTTAFSSSKSAQRILAQSLAKQLGPKGVHIAYIVIDGVIDTADTRAGFAKGKPDDFFLKPEAIARTALDIARQDRSAWTFQTDLRPFGENW